MGLSCPLGISSFVSAEAKFFWSYKKSLYWPSLLGQDGWILASFFFFFFAFFIDLNFVSVHKNAKKNLANIQPPWPHAWSITHMYYIVLHCIVLCMNTNKVYRKAPANFSGTLQNKDENVKCYNKNTRTITKIRSNWMYGSQIDQFTAVCLITWPLVEMRLELTLS